MRRVTLAEAADWARDRGVAATDAAEYLREYDHLTLVRLLLAQHRAHPDGGAPDEALGLLDRLRDAAPGIGAGRQPGRDPRAHGLAHDALGRRPQALATLADALTLAPEPEGYARLFLDEGEPALALLRATEPDGPAGAPGATRARRRAARPRPGTGRGPASHPWPTR